MSTSQRLVVQRVHNNNVVLAVDEAGRSVVVTGAGVGFGVRRGFIVDTTKAEAVYVPENDARADTAAGMLATIPRAEILTARGIVEEACQITGLPHPEILLLPVADHLHHAIRRAREGIVISLPLVWEVRHLYPAELAAGRRALEIIRDKLVVELPEDEATAFALHFVSATFTGAVLDRTMTMTRSLTQIFDHLDESLGAPLDRNSEAATRFVTHLRYLFVRLSEDRHDDDLSSIRSALEESVPQVMRLAQGVAEVLASTWGHTVNDAETTYIALHIHRLMSAAGHPA